MTTLIRPCQTADISDNYQTHVDRGSPNPGTDYKCGVGSEVWAMAAGTVTEAVSSNAADGGRYVTIQFDDPNLGSQALHLSKVLCTVGQHLDQRQVYALSGASGFGSDTGYGPHLHQTLYVGGRNADLELWLDPSTPAPAPTASGTTPRKRDDMRFNMDTDNTYFLYVDGKMGCPSGDPNDVALLERWVNGTGDQHFYRAELARIKLLVNSVRDGGGVLQL